MKQVDLRTENPRQRRGWRVFIGGTGGQGVLTAARLLCEMGVARGHDVVSGQLHGMSQRSGVVQASVMIDCGISPVMKKGTADLVLGFEPVETVRALPFTSPHAVVYMNTAPVIPYVLGQSYVLGKGEAKYPDTEELLESIRAVTPSVFAFDASEMAEEAGSTQVLNMVMLGCALGSGMLPCSADDFWETVARKMPARTAEANTKAFIKGARLGEQFQLSKEEYEAQNWY